MHMVAKETIAQLLQAQTCNSCAYTPQGINLEFLSIMYWEVGFSHMTLAMYVWPGCRGAIIGKNSKSLSKPDRVMHLIS